MRARAAYISSFGTSGIIVASALLMLAMMSALVAFHAWPVGTTTGGTVSAVPLTPGGSASRLHQVRTAPAPASGVKSAAAAARRLELRTHVSTRGLSKGSAPSAAPAGGIVKLPEAASGHAQSGQQPTAPTAPQQPAPHGVTVPPTQPPPDSPGPRLQLPSVPIPGGTTPDEVEHSVNGVLGQLPPLPSPKLELIARS